MKIEIDGCNFEVMYTKEPIIVDNKTFFYVLVFQSLGKLYSSGFMLV